MQATTPDPGAAPRLEADRQVSVWGGQNEASWWSLIYHGMLAAGLATPDQQRDYLNSMYGASFATLDEVRSFDLQGVSDGFDKNQNGFVCAYDLRGTRAYNDDPYLDSPGSASATTRRDSPSGCDDPSFR